IRRNLRVLQIHCSTSRSTTHTWSKTISDLQANGERMESGGDFSPGFPGAFRHLLSQSLLVRARERRVAADWDRFDRFRNSCSSVPNRGGVERRVIHDGAAT